MIIIRSPSVFPYVWAIAKNCIRKTARDKMIFPSSKAYLKVLDQYIDRHVLPECIAEGGCGSPAYGLPNLLGDDSPNPWWRASANPVKKTKKVSFGDSRFSSTLSASTMDETDALEAVAMMRPRLVIPCHYDCPGFFTRRLNPADVAMFAKECRKLGVRCEVMGKGDTLDIPS